jgi:hypothetical protein
VARETSEGSASRPLSDGALPGELPRCRSTTTLGQRARHVW